MKLNELRDLSAADLQKQAEEFHKDLFNLRFQLHTGHLENTARISEVRRNIARVNTILREKQG